MGNNEITNQFDQQGYLIIKNVFSEEKLYQIKRLVDEIISNDLTDPFITYYLQHRIDQGVLYDLYQRHPQFREMASDPTILKSLKGGLGANFYMYENSLIYKPKGRKNEVPWHQDFISRPTEPIKYIAWMPIDDVNKENGTIQIIPGSHKRGFLPWYRVEGETHHDRVKKEYVEQNKENIIYVNLNAGDVLVFNMLLIHGSEEIHSDVPRRVYRVSYQSMDKTIFTPRGTPLVMMGGEPEYLMGRMDFVKEKELIENKDKKKKNKAVRLINKIGRKLSRYGDD